MGTLTRKVVRGSISQWIFVRQAWDLIPLDWKIERTKMQFRGDVMPLTRRELYSLFPVALLPALHLVQNDPSAAQRSLASTVYPLDNLPLRTANNAQFRDVLKGRLATGESLEVHETTLPPGGAPHPPHHHLHSEMWLIREGTVELMVSGKTFRLGPGSVGFVHSNDEHGIRNVGATPATYFVVAIGPGAGS
jgi:mannose-6-phosphate isomerase-like protein (cupin superfamily)